jgi:serine/threonine protein kinase/Tfp pilus assembly protein PilF
MPEAGASKQSLVGQTISHYKIVRQLGAGGMGVVYEAEDTDLGRHVAIKFLSTELQNDEPTLERFKREARAASALNHPGICTVHAIEQFNHQHFIAMELIDGTTLAKRISQGKFELNELLDVGIQIADALESAHSKGIAHRDLKPANIMINDRGQVKILDFGLAKVEAGRGTAAKGNDLSKLETMVDPGQLTVAGTVMGTVNYMSPEQARGKLTDSRTDLFSLGALLYQMATGELPFQGDTDAVVFESILNREPRPAEEINPQLPGEFGRILGKAMEKDRSLRYQSATDLKTDLLRLKRQVDSGARHAAELSDSRAGAEKEVNKSIAVLYFENLSGAKEDEYFRDGITEDIITELSKIKGLNVFSRALEPPQRDQQVTPAHIGRQVGVAYVLAGSLRRAGDRLRLNTQLVDAQTDYPIWSERYDREMEDVFEVQDEIAHNIAEALRITLTPQEKEALAAKPTENLQAYDLYLRGRSYARRRNRQDMEFALQLFENAVKLDPSFALAYAAIASGCADAYYWSDRSEAEARWIERARDAADKASALQPDLPEAKVARAWIHYANDEYDEAIRTVKEAIESKRDCDGAHSLLLRALFSAGRYQEVTDLAELAIESSGTDYNVYVPILNTLGALGKEDAKRNFRQRALQAIEGHLRDVPEDAQARILLAAYYAQAGRKEDAVREATMAMALRPNEGVVQYNAACTFCALNMKQEALEALEKAWRAGNRDPVWARRDPDLEILHGDPEFEKLYPEPKQES